MHVAERHISLFRTHPTILQGLYPPLNIACKNVFFGVPSQVEQFGNYRVHWETYFIIPHLS